MGVIQTGNIFKGFTFDGVNSKDYGVYITGEAVFNAPERAVEMVSIAGRNGAYALDKGHFENIEVTYPAGIFAENETDFANAISDFRNFLCSKVGYVRLQDEYNPDEYRLAIYKSGLEVDHEGLINGEFDITFNCKPQRYLTSGEETIEVGAWGETETKSGSVVTFDAEDTDKVKSLVAKIVPVQDLHGYDAPWIHDDNEQVPYTFRATHGTVSDVGNYIYDTLVGGTVAWNQLLKDFSPPVWTISTNPSVTITNGEVYVQPTATWNGTQTTGVSIIAGHKYLVSVTGRVETSGTNVEIGSGFVGNTMSIGVFSTTTNKTIAKIYNPANSGTGAFNLSNRTGVANFYMSDPQLIDLTAMFGSTIADYIYSLEQANAGDGVAWFKSLFPEDYYAYDSGTLMSVNASAHVMRDANNNVIGNYALDSDLVLRGIPKLDASNNLYYDGDTYESDGKHTIAWTEYTFTGNESWDLSAGGIFSTAMSGMESPSTTADRATGIVCSIYPPSITYALNENMTDKAMLRLNGRIYIKDSAYSTKDAFKAHMANQKLVYKLATPTTETADPYTNPQIVDDFGTEEYVDYAVSQGTRDVAIPVGHKTDHANICPITGHTDVDVTVEDDIDNPTQTHTYTTSLGTTVYGGELDVVSGVLTTKWAMVDLGSLTWYTTSGTSSFKTPVPSDMAIVTNDKLANWKCSILPIVKGNDLASVSSGAALLNTSDIFVKDSTFDGMTTAQAKAALNGVYLCYELKTSAQTTTTLTGEQIDLLLGTNNIYADTGDVAVEYGHDPNVLTNPTLFASSPMLEVTGYGDIHLGDNDITINNGDMGNIIVFNGTTYTGSSTKTITFDDTYANNGDAITLANISYFEHCVWGNGGTVSTFGKSASGTATIEGSIVATNTTEVTVADTNIGFVYGTSSTHTSTAQYSFVDSTYGTVTVDITMTVAYDGIHTFTFSRGRTQSQSPPQAKSDGVPISRVFGTVTLYSTQPALGNPLYIDLDIGEAYKIEGGSAVSVNNGVELPAELPTLPSGNTTVTYDNTITDLDIVPRWWKV